jgi:glycosyltransferase involved in cell wall biosynthesis
MPPKVCIVIPCYNQGHYLKDALDSVERCDKSLFELIIINDGSTDDSTNNYLKELSHRGFNVVFQENMGLSGARNAGIALAGTEYILLLDADNMIRPEYLTRGIEVLDQDPHTAVVYGDAQLFGEQQDVWTVGSFNLQRLMISNFIDACAMVRKSVFRTVGLYDTKMRLGWEDWDLWLRIAFAGHDFYYINRVMFDYRIVNTSMSKMLYSSYEKPNSIENYIHDKFPSKMGHKWIINTYAGRFRKSPFRFLTKLILKAYFPDYYNKLLSKNKIRNGL